MYQVLAVGGLTTLEAVILVLFVILFAWIALSFASLLGGVDRAGDAAGRNRSTSTRTRRCRRSRRAPRCCSRPTTKTPRSRARARAGGLRVRRRDRRGRPVRHLHPQRHDRPGHLHRRGSGVPGAARSGSADARIYYRHRPKNDAKKAGNIAEWLQRFGGHYEQHDRARCRLADDRRHAGAARRRDGAAIRASG